MKNTIRSIIVLLCFVIVLSSCSSVAPTMPEPEITQIRTICQLATLECYYHNVAKITLEKENIFQKERKLWIEYTGIAKVGIDISKVRIDRMGNDVTIFMPDAEFISANVDATSFNENSFIMSADNKIFFKNEITAEDTQKAMQAAQDKMIESTQNNKTLMLNAQARAEKLIKNYIDQIGKLNNTHYNITWEYLEDTVSTDIIQTETTTIN